MPQHLLVIAILRTFYEAWSKYGGAEKEDHVRHVQSLSRRWDCSVCYYTQSSSWQDRFLQKVRLPSQPLNSLKTSRWCERSKSWWAYRYDSLFTTMYPYIAEDLPIIPPPASAYSSYRTDLVTPPATSLPGLIADSARGERSERITDVRSACETVAWRTKDTEGPRMNFCCMLTAGEKKTELGIQSMGLFLHSQQVFFPQKKILWSWHLSSDSSRNTIVVCGDQVKYQRPGIFGGRFLFWKSVLVQPGRIAEGVVLNGWWGISVPVSTYASPIFFELFEGVKAAEVGPRCCSFCSVLDDTCC